MTINLDELRKIATLYPKDRVVDGDTVLALVAELETFRLRFDAMRRQRDGYRNQLRKTEQQVARVQELREGQLCGHCADEVQDALEGELE